MVAAVNEFNSAKCCPGGQKRKKSGYDRFVDVVVLKTAGRRKKGGEWKTATEAGNGRKTRE